MSLDKAIEHHKEKRKPYKGGKRFFKSCRNHGGCSWCEWNRMYQRRCKELSMKQDIKEYKEGEYV